VQLHRYCKLFDSKVLKWIYWWRFHACCCSIYDDIATE